MEQDSLRTMCNINSMNDTVISKALKLMVSTGGRGSGRPKHTWMNDAQEMKELLIESGKIEKTWIISETI